MSTELMGVEGRRLMAAQPGGLTSGLAMHLVFTSWRTGLRSGYQVENVRPIRIGRLPVCGLLRNTGNTGLRTVGYCGDAVNVGDLLYVR